MIVMNQVANRFLIETLEPQAEDSYFTWNFFDAILGQKEGYSAYSFEDIAADYLKKNPELKRSWNNAGIPILLLQRVETPNWILFFKILLTSNR